MTLPALAASSPILAGAGLAGGIPGVGISGVGTGQVLAGSDTESRYHPTLPGLRDLLGGQGIKRGASYLVDGSTSLALALAAGPSSAGSWCGVVGMPTFGSQSAAGIGVDLDRLALVPEPGRQWMEVVAALLDALDLIVIRPPTAAKDAEVRRLAARMRQRGSSLVVVGGGAWPGSELRLSVTGSQWHGIGGDGHGHLSARQALVSITGKGSAGHPKSTKMWLPDQDGQIRPVESEQASRPVLRSVR